MKLDEFVKNTLLDITRGVADAQEETPLFIAPGIVEGEKQIEGQMISFEVAVTVAGEGRGGISVLGIGELRGNASREAVNRISFEVPVFFHAPTKLNKRHHSNEGPLNPVAEEDIKK